MTIVGETPVARAARADVERQDQKRELDRLSRELADAQNRDRELTNRIALLTNDNRMLTNRIDGKDDKIARLQRERDQLQAVLEFIHTNTRRGGNIGHITVIAKLDDIHKVTAAFVEPRE